MPKLAPWSVAELAKWWSCKTHTVLALIHSRRLLAFQLHPGAKRPTWRIRWQDIEAFERGEQQKPDVKQQRRKQQDPAFVEYY